jgi:hypothetical protein
VRPLHREPSRLLLLLAAQQFVYRQLMYLVVAQLVVTALAGARLPWQKLHRRGIAGQSDQRRANLPERVRAARPRRIRRRGC